MLMVETEGTEDEVTEILEEALWMDVEEDFEGEEAGDVERDYIFGLIWRCCGPKQDLKDYLGILIFCLLSYYIMSKDRGL